MIQIYLYGCNCGQKAKLTRKVKAYAKENNIEIDILNSKYDLDARFDHMNWLRLNGLDTSIYQSIVVENNSVVPLSQWTR